jgi:serine/threonine-protein kinase
MVVSKDAVKQMLVKHGFYSTCESFNFDFCNPHGDFTNQFEDNGDGTVTDRATHLMWEKGGSEEGRTYLDALRYAQELNNMGLGGHSDWRIPTIEELASLLESSWKKEDLFIDPVFDTKQKSCWSMDTMGLERAWNVNFHLGYVADDPMTCRYWVRAVRSVP